MEAIFLYGFVALIFGVPFLYFAFRALQRWKCGDPLFSAADYGRFAGRLVVMSVGAASASRWGLVAAALVLLAGLAWMGFVEWRSTRA